jgi:hypothetical protein
MESLFFMRKAGFYPRKLLFIKVHLQYSQYRKNIHFFINKLIELMKILSVGEEKMESECRISIINTLLDLSLDLNLIVYISKNWSTQFQFKALNLTYYLLHKMRNI